MLEFGLWNGFLKDDVDYVEFSLELEVDFNFASSGFFSGEALLYRYIDMRSVINRW